MDPGKIGCSFVILGEPLRRTEVGKKMKKLKNIIWSLRVVEDWRTAGIIP